MTQNVTKVDYKDFKVDSANIPTKDHLVLQLKPIPSRDACQYIEKITDKEDQLEAHIEADSVDKGRNPVLEEIFKYFGSYADSGEHTDKVVSN